MTAVIPASGVIDRAEFVRRLGERFPAVAAQIDETDRGLLHLEMAVLARATSAAIEAKNDASVAELLSFAEEILGAADSSVENAIYVSFLENVFLGETRPGYVAHRERLSPRLAKGLAALEQHFERLTSETHKANE
jgi:hypothetical protein